MSTLSDDVVLRPTITTTNAAYSAGDVIGGIITLTLSPSSSIPPVKLRSIVLKDDANQKPALQLLFFRSSPVGTYTDNGVVAPSTADLGNLVYVHIVGSADWVSIQGVAKAVASYELDDGPLLQPATTALFMVIVATGTPDYTASSTDLTAELGFERGV